MIRNITRNAVNARCKLLPILVVKVGGCSSWLYIHSSYDESLHSLHGLPVIHTVPLPPLPSLSLSLSLPPLPSSRVPQPRPYFSTFTFLIYILLLPRRLRFYLPILAPSLCFGLAIPLLAHPSEAAHICWGICKTRTHTNALQIDSPSLPKNPGIPQVYQFQKGLMKVGAHFFLILGPLRLPARLVLLPLSPRPIIMISRPPAVISAGSLGLQY